jgi:hypothetical protein
MSLARVGSQFRAKHRIALFVAAICGWVLLITVLHFRNERGSRTIKGATELLEIGALPVT